MFPRFFRKKKLFSKVSELNSSLLGKGAFSKLNINKTPKEVTDEEWKKVLTPEQYEITRESGTEKPFSGKYDKFFENGIYHCVCCGAQLFKYVLLLSTNLEDKRMQFFEVQSFHFYFSRQDLCNF